MRENFFNHKPGHVLQKNVSVYMTYLLVPSNVALEKLVLPKPCVKKTSLYF